MPEAQYQATLELHRMLIDRHGIEIDRDHITGHFRLDSVSRAHCPGDAFPWDRLFSDLEGTLTDEQRAIIRQATEFIDVNIQQRAQEIHDDVINSAVGLSADQVAGLNDALVRLQTLHDELAQRNEELKALL